MVFEWVTKLLKTPRFDFLLFFLGVLGLLAALLTCLHSNVDSDTVGIGIASLALRDDPWLAHIGFPVLNPYLFTDYLPGLPVQVLSNSDPYALRLTGYAIYLLLALCFSLSAYWLTGDRTKTLLSVCLIAGLPTGVLILLSSPLYHNSTMAMALLYTVLFYNVEKRGRLLVGLLLVLAFLIVLSDLLFAALFILPYLGVALIRAARRGLVENKLSIVVSLVLVVEAVLGQLAKMGTSFFVSKTLSLNPPPRVPFALLDGILGVFIITGLSGVAILFVFWRLFARRHEGLPQLDDRAYYMLGMLGLASLIVLLGYLLVGEFGMHRFMVYPALFLLLAGVLLYDKSRLVAGILIILIMVSVLNNFSNAMEAPAPNQLEYGLINLLDSHGLSYGYSEFRYSNTITYLSNGRVKVLGTNLMDNQSSISVNHWLQEYQWYEDRPGFILYPSNKPPAYIDAHVPERILEYDRFAIAVYDSPLKDVYS